jgi:hypothetical protein
MFCPKCGYSNPDDGRFCRSCGTAIGGVSTTLSQTKKGKPAPLLACNDGDDESFEGAITKIFTGVAFLIVAVVLAVTGIAGGKYWWFWMLIPAFGSLGAGVAQWLKVRRAEALRQNLRQQPVEVPDSLAAAPAARLAVGEAPSPASDFAARPAESRYKTGDLVPPSVTDATTRHLDATSDSEGKTMTLPK